MPHTLQIAPHLIRYICGDRRPRLSIYEWSGSFAITALQSESFFERESGIKGKVRVSKGGGKPQVVLLLLRSPYAYGVQIKQGG